MVTGETRTHRESCTAQAIFEEASMTETQVLMGKIAALRQRLEQARGLVDDAGSAVAALAQGAPKRPDPLIVLQQRIALSRQQAQLVEGTLRPAPPGGRAGETEAPLPAALTNRARRLLPQVRELLADLAKLASEPFLNQGADDPMARLQREATLLAELAVRAIQTLPETPSAQLRLCEGAEALLKRIQQHLGILRLTLEQRQEEARRLDQLDELLAALGEGKSPGLQPFQRLADEVIQEVTRAQPLRFNVAAADRPARFAAAHGLTVARVVARVLRQLPEWRRRPEQPVLAALLHDAGLVRISADVLAYGGPLDDSQKRVIESHASAGAEMVGRLGNDLGWLVEVVGGHHERLDGTGYPSGLSDLQIPPLVRLLAVCDVYAALCSPRPHRRALETRTALTDTLMMAQHGLLDAHCARTLLNLSLYPAGSAVELADGAVGVVVATHQAHTELDASTHPVVALLTDNDGKPLPFPCHLDLAQCDGRNIVRGLLGAERRQLLGEHYPEWA
jgi:HD-GYP domain-containing protein (c-di-GMP phosphodiesterase class II)